MRASLGADLHIDSLLTLNGTWGSAGTLAPGRMGPPGAVSWTLAGTGVLLSLGRSRARRIAAILAVGVSGVAMLSMVGSLLGVDPLHTVPRLTAIAAQTATFILAAGLGLIAAMPEREPMRTLMEDSGAGILVRRALPILVVLPVVLGYLRVKGQRMGLFDTGMGTAVLVVALIAVSCTVLWWCVRALRGREDALRESEARLTAFLDQLPLGVGMFNAEGRSIILNPIMHGLHAGMDAVAQSERSAPLALVGTGGSLVEPSEWPGARALRGEMVNPGMDFLHKHDDGTEVWTRVSAAPFRNRCRSSGPRGRAGHQRSEARRGGAARGRPAQGRVPGDAGPRAAQPAGPDPQRAADPAGCAGDAEPAAAGPRDDGAAGAAHGRGWSTTCSTCRGSRRGKIELRRERVELAAVVAQRGRDQPPADRAAAARADVSPAARAAPAGRRPDAAGAGVRATC